MISHFLKTSLALLILMCLQVSCASYMPQVAKVDADWSAQGIPEGKILAYRTYLVGDAGNAAKGENLPVITYLKKKLVAAPKNSTVVFLGDNIYPAGMPKEKDDERELAEHKILLQTNAVKEYPGKVLFIPGNHDWYKYGLDGLRRQQEFIESELGSKKVWYPEVGCGGPKVIEASDNLVYIVIDSQWWLTNWKKYPGINQGCDASNRTDFMRLFKDAVKGNKEKNIVVVMHHPMETYGRHGGHFTAKDYLLPVPGLSTLLPFLRTNVGSLQDNVNASFQELRKGLLAHVRLNGNATFVSGHEHNLQYIEKDNQRYIVSGAGSKVAPAGMGEGSRFAYGGRGWSELDLYEDGSMWVSFYTVDENGKNERLLYQKEVQTLSATDNYVAPTSFDKYPLTSETVECQLVHEDYNRSKLGLLILGDHYRKSFNDTIDLNLLDLARYKGGLQTIKKGGGNQTKSIRLEANDGKQYAMRSLAKDPTATLGYELSQSQAIQKLVADAFTAAHPLSALPVAPLADAAGVNHTNPELYYVPAQPALGKYNAQFGDKVYLVEERPDDDLWGEQESFDNAEDIISTSKMLARIRKSHKHVLDHKAMARARAFDVLLGDWDRHDDQWRWIVEKKGGWTYYSPIPRDRDQAFSHYDGLMLGLARMLVPDTRPLAPFKGNPKSVHWSTHGNRFFDATFLAGIDRDTWLREAQHLQENVTDEVIEAAFKETWPETIYRADALQIITTLKERRDNLVELITDLYEFNAKVVEIIGTDKKDQFAIETRQNGNVMVRVFDADGDGDREGKARYQRLFLASETKEIILYGLDNEDTFEFSGNGKSGMRIRLIGGTGKDQVRNKNDVEGRRKKVYYYDYTEGTKKTKFNGISGIKDRRSPIARYNTYSRLSLDKNYDFLSLVPVIGLNPDNGFLLGVAGTLTKYGFKREPFASQHTLGGVIALETNGLKFDYNGEFTDFFGESELLLDGGVSTSLYGVNFYGFGNETVNEEVTRGLDYNRVRQQHIHFAPMLLRRPDPATEYSFGPRYSIIQTARTEGRFLADNFEGPVENGVFSNYTYLGLEAGFSFDNRDSKAMPTRGVHLELAGSYQLSIAGPGASFPKLSGALTINQRLDRRGNLVLANRVGYSETFTVNLAYFQAATLGGVGTDSNFRGFRRERFSGQKAFFLNNDLRLRLLSSNRRAVPFSLGVLAGYDLGRVWIEEEDSNIWHYSYGGGIFISPFDLATIKISYFVGDGEIGRMIIGGGFFF
ncbi:metallophosphoesterase [Neolewinella persica]|uniref:metallophosphoesterase n=1 Tax=Neolewinella persica TaxID=70998 RepID=UPI00037CE310|nr:metallophosphoesterase [Neolewinella persica]